MNPDFSLFMFPHVSSFIFVTCILVFLIPCPVMFPLCVTACSILIWLTVSPVFECLSHCLSLLHCQLSVSATLSCLRSRSNTSLSKSCLFVLCQSNLCFFQFLYSLLSFWTKKRMDWVFCYLYKLFFSNLFSVSFLFYMGVFALSTFL